jgi:trehalose 6-phosphate synthase/phosphatase
MIQKFLSFEIRNQIREKYKKSGKRLLLLDYDGTLVNIVSHPDQAVPDSRVVELLNNLTADEKNIVVLISGRDRNTIDKWFHNSQILYVAEHGALIKFVGHNTWVSFEEIKSDWKPDIKKILEVLVGLYSGSFIEEKEYSLVWHYRMTQIRNESKEIADACQSILEFDSSNCIKLKRGKKILEVSYATVNKGDAATKFIHVFRPDFTLAIGDDATDEDMFGVLRTENEISIKVGTENTKAKYCVVNPGLVLSFLEFLTS